MRRLLAIVAAGWLLLIGQTGCGTPINAAHPGATQPAAAQPTSTPTPTETITHGARHNTEVTQPPPFKVRYGNTELHLNPITYCYTGGCVDGVDDDPPAVGSPEELLVFVPVSDFDELIVQQVEHGDPCSGRRVEADAKPVGDGWWSVRPRGPAADYQVTLFARGGGDMVADLKWRTPYDQPLPEPSARLALVAYGDGQPISYGVELEVSDLPAPPARYAATITATAGNGRSMTFEATPSTAICVGEGGIYFDGPDDKGNEAAALGDFPFTTRVELTLDGVVYIATATFPDDVIKGNEPSVALRFDPPLPR